MKKTRTKILAGTALLLGVALAAGIVWAKATKTAVSGTYESEFGSPERMWIDDEGVLHVRRMPTKLTFPAVGTTGDLVGTGTGMVNVNLDLVTGTEDLQSFWIWNVSWGSLSGTFEGRLDLEAEEHIGYGTAVLHGTAGDFVGMKMLIDVRAYGIGKPVEFEGIVLDPHGE